MLCFDCNKFFIPQSAEIYLSRKTTAIYRLKAFPTTRELPQVQELENDLEDYRQLCSYTSKSQPPCPWYFGDLSWLPPALVDVNTKVEDDVWGAPGRSGSEIAASALIGCSLCLLLWTVIQHIEVLDGSSDVVLESWLETHPISLKPTRLRFLVQGRSQHLSLEHSWIYVHLLVPEKKNCDTQDLKLLSPRGISSADVSCFNFLRQAFEICKSHHPACRQRDQDGWIPTRLLDVGALGLDSPTVRLIERSELEGKKEYLTLSHVWGTQKFLTLTRTNYESFKGGIQVADLHQTFQDAIRMTSRLQLRYIWIDSLCIIQDSIEDWQSEAASMGKVYSNGMCNLAACNAIRPGDGFFRPRVPANGGPIAASISWKDHTSDIDLLYDWFDVIKYHTPLYNRGWVLQERLLSPRTMHFSTFPFWECRESVNCEAYPNFNITENYSWVQRPRKLNIGELSTQVDVFMKWKEIVHDYSRCQLTVEGDRLIALCGVAKELSKAINGVYLAGLWMDNIIQGLLWQISRGLFFDQPNTYRTTKFIGPTWSWTSIHGRIDPHEYRIYRPAAEFISATITAENQDSFGKLVKGELEIRCVIFPLPNLLLLYREQKRLFSKGRFDEWTMNLDDSKVVDSGNSEAFFLPLAESRYDPTSTDLYVCGIMVQKVSEERRPAVYRRIGFLAASYEGQIGASDCFVNNWKEPPWPQSKFQQITLV